MVSRVALAEIKDEIEQAEARLKAEIRENWDAHWNSRVEMVALRDLVLERCPGRDVFENFEMQLENLETDVRASSLDRDELHNEIQELRAAFEELNEQHLELVSQVKEMRTQQRDLAQKLQIWGGQMCTKVNGVIADTNQLKQNVAGLIQAMQLHIEWHQQNK